MVLERQAWARLGELYVPGLGCRLPGLGNEYRWWHEMVCQGELKATREINIVQSSWGIHFT